MMESYERKVGLLGGSFNPPHLGHVQICRYLFSRRLCAQVWIMPCYEHPFKKPLASFEDRLAMCRFNFQEFGSKVWVTDVERRLGGISHTVRTIEFLKLDYPENRFQLVVGSDIKKEKKQWKDFNRIKKMVNIVEVPRGKDSPIIDISSTEIRRRIKAREGHADVISPSVAIYIVTHGLYQD